MERYIKWIRTNKICQIMIRGLGFILMGLIGVNVFMLLIPTIDKYNHDNLLYMIGLVHVWGGVTLSLLPIYLVTEWLVDENFFAVKNSAPPVKSENESPKVIAPQQHINSSTLNNRNLTITSTEIIETILQYDNISAPIYGVTPEQYRAILLLLLSDERDIWLISKTVFGTMHFDHLARIDYIQHYVRLGND